MKEALKKQILKDYDNIQSILIDLVKLYNYDLKAIFIITDEQELNIEIIAKENT